MSSWGWTHLTDSSGDQSHSCILYFAQWGLWAPEKLQGFRVANLGWMCSWRSHHMTIFSSWRLQDDPGGLANLVSDYELFGAGLLLCVKTVPSMMGFQFWFWLRNAMVIHIIRMLHILRVLQLFSLKSAFMLHFPGNIFSVEGFLSVKQSKRGECW